MSRYDAIPDALVTADLGEGVGVQPVVDWSVSRQMSGGGLPGQARGASGSSVGSGSVTVDSPAGRSPWTPGPIRPGGRVALDARADAAAPMSPVARMVARDVSGTATSPALSVTIEDDIERLRGPARLPAAMAVTYRGDDVVPMDAAAAVERLAAGAGFWATTQPSPVHATVLAAPLCGSAAPTVGTASSLSSIARWQSWLGQAALAGADGHLWMLATRPLSSDSGVVTVTARYACAPSTITGADIRLTGLGLQLLFETAHVIVNGAGLAYASFPAGSWPSDRTTIRVAELQLDMRTASWQTRARVDGGAWGLWASVAPSGSPAASSAVGVKAFTDSMLYDVQVAVAPSPIDHPHVGDPLTAHVDLAGSTLTALSLGGSEQRAWDVIQDIARCTLGAAWVDESGALVFRGRDRLRTGTVVEAVISEESLEDVPWTISTDDVADRVEVTYRPPVMLTTAGMAPPRHTVWESTEPMMLLAAQTLVVEADIEGAASSLSNLWLPVWNTAYFPEEHSRWNAFPNSDSTGAQPADSAIRVTSTLLAANRIRIAVTNTTTSTLYVTSLTQRAYTVARAGEAVTLSQGATASTARSTLTYDLGSWVQDHETAQDILDWLAGTTSEPLPTLTGVRVIPDTSRRLGQVVKIVDRTTDLEAKALIAGISMSGSDGSLTQNLDLTILWATEGDVARYIGPNPALATELALATYLTTTLGAGATEADLAAWLPTGVI